MTVTGMHGRRGAHSMWWPMLVITGLMVVLVWEVSVLIGGGGS